MKLAAWLTPARASESPPHYMATCPSHADIGKACGLEGGYEAHVAVTGRVRIDRIGFENSRAAAAGMCDGAGDQLMGKTLPA